MFCEYLLFSLEVILNLSLVCMVELFLQIPPSEELKNKYIIFW